MLIARGAAAAAAGVLLAISYDPLGWSAAAPLGVAALSLATWRAPWRLSLGLGFLAGFVWFGIAVMWVTRVAAAAWPGLAVVEALYVAVLAVLLAGTSRLPLAAWWQAVGWATIETIRSSWPLGGFPWLRLAHATPDTPLATLLPAVGIVGTSAAVALLGTSLAALLVGIASRSTGRSLLALSGPVVLAGGIAVTAAVLPAYADPGGGRAGPDVRVALVQGDTPGIGLSAMSGARVVLDNHVAATLALAADVAAGREPVPDLVVWPENASDIDPFADADAYAAISGAVRAVGAPALTGIVVDRNPDAAAAGAGWSNRVQAWSATGEPGDFYDKRHGVPFGEFVPLRGLLTPIFPVLQQVPQDMREGLRPNVVAVGGRERGAGADPSGSRPPGAPLEVGVLICFEVADVGLARDAVADGARLIAVPTNNATYMGTPQVRQQLQIARTTAMSTRRAVVVAATNGVTAVVGADGTVRAELPTRTSGVLTADVAPRDDFVPAVAHGLLIDRVVWILAAIGALLSLMTVRLAGRRDEESP